MVRKRDILRDEQARIILDQLNTKTVGPPPTSTGLVGDQAPASIISLSDIENVKNQVNLEANNIDALEALNTIRAITDLKGYGPIVDSGKIHTATITASGSSGGQKVVTPKKGEVLLLGIMDGLWDTSPGSSVTFGYYIVNDQTDAQVLGGTVSSSSTNASLSLLFDNQMPQYITHPFSVKITVSTMGSASSIVISAFTTRVR
jgi:hypothetical protein